MINKKRLTNFFWTVAILGTWITAGYMLFKEMPSARETGPVLLQNPFVIDNSLHYVWNGDVFRDCEGSITREIHQKGVIYYLEGFEMYKGFKLGKRSVVLTVDLEPLRTSLSYAPATYVARETVYCNFIKKFFRKPTVYEYETLEFFPFKDTRIEQGLYFDDLIQSVPFYQKGKTKD